MAKKKVLLMGKAHSGKTSMRSIIFANYLARDTMRLSATLDVENHHVRFLGDLVLNLWDCGGQDAFYESYFERDRETIFRSVELLIYVFDIASDCPEKDFEHFTGVLEAIEENSPDARIFVLVHKMDLVAKEEQKMIFEDRRRLIEDCCHSCGVLNFQCFGTSIWDETLYKAWSEIVTNLIPNIKVLESHLKDFCRICDADEVVLFERATFLVISHAHGKGTKNENKLIGNNTTAENDSSNVNETSMPVDNATPTYINLDSNTAAGGTHTTPSLVPDSSNNNEEIASISSSLPETMPSSIDGGTINIDHHDHLPSVFSEVTSPLPNDDANIAAQNQQSLQTNNANSNISTSSPHPPLPQNQPQQNPSSSDNSATSNSPKFDTHRFEKISNIVKQFKLSCEKAQSQFQGMEVSNSRFTACIDAFTANTYIMVIVSNPSIHPTAATLLNIKNARRHFERFIPRS